MELIKKFRAQKKFVKFTEFMDSLPKEELNERSVTITRPDDGNGNQGGCPSLHEGGLCPTDAENATGEQLHFPRIFD